ncbi:mediator of RNA polymerase II transcription subunit 30 isoform X3 [Paramormyrops kingsleyae]|uniref:mediator of RNA polymerase II transcription subunit 30 isoform X3 n=1 Tax=Paramormyrops kingsleyae TaxID=1676925 RepID=UPI000CD601B7|nr:mediator of RNA polymerase II transcription subunit 30 isoform X3 [Paramormyrops kingsleyae]
MQGSFQQRNPASVAMTTPPVAGACMTATPFPGQQAQAAREVNTASLCRIGQETVQDIVFRTMEIFQLLRNMQQLIPYVEEDSKHDEHSAQQSRYASDERREVLEVNKKMHWRLGEDEVRKRVKLADSPHRDIKARRETYKHRYHRVRVEFELALVYAF